jgi:hypothetical protein
VRVMLCVGLMAVCVVAGACSSSKPTGTAAPSSTDATTTTTAGVTDTPLLNAKVQLILSSVNVAIAQAHLNGYGSTGPAFDTAAQQLQNLSFPANAQADAKSVTAVLEKLSADADQVATGNGVAQTVSNDEGTEVAASDALRHDLGLPPAPVS